MRAKLAKDRHTGAQTLVIRTTRGESLDVDRARWLAAGQRYMVPFRYENEGTQCRLDYDVTGCEPLHDVLRSPMGGARFAGVLLGVLAAMERDDGLGRVPYCMQYDPKLVYVAPQGYPLFVYVPLAGLAESRHTVATLLSALAESVRFSDAADEGYRRALSGFLGANPVVTTDGFRSFLQTLLPGAVSPLTNGSAASSSVSHDVSQGAVADDGVEDDGDGATVASTLRTVVVPNQPSGLAGLREAGPEDVQRDAPSSGGVRSVGMPDAVAPGRDSSTRAEGRADSRDGGRAVGGRAVGDGGVGDGGVGDGGVGDGGVEQSPFKPQVPALEPLPLRCVALPRRPMNPASKEYATTWQNSEEHDATRDEQQPVNRSTVSGQPVVHSPAFQQSAVQRQASVQSVPEQPIPAQSASQEPQSVIEESQPSFMPDDADGEGATMLKPSPRNTAGFTVRRLRDGRSITVYARQATIGRSKTASIHMGGNTNVSRIHALISMLDDGRFMITDNHSANGTSVRGSTLAAGGTEYVQSGGDFTLADDTFVVTRL